ncbi:hypothetical protein EJ03DRAFT_64691 [Teratosphaeria nubilosa]|uniref:Uncharacterized protein n=1 Tax=Teratosphaeria nubilosa TaxID=161662 RepID=A0A6G1LC60_9PEZI|nr:hypothetical protein EJ03DRAFT_64691 [Teratosphaeria nubilosa]
MTEGGALDFLSEIPSLHDASLNLAETSLCCEDRAPLLPKLSLISYMGREISKGGIVKSHPLQSVVLTFNLSVALAVLVLQGLQSSVIRPSRQDLCSSFQAGTKAYCDQDFCIKADPRRGRCEICRNKVTTEQHGDGFMVRDSGHSHEFDDHVLPAALGFAKGPVPSACTLAKISACRDLQRLSEKQIPIVYMHITAPPARRGTPRIILAPNWTSRRDGLRRQGAKRNLCSPRGQQPAPGSLHQQEPHTLQTREKRRVLSGKSIGRDEHQ